MVAFQRKNVFVCLLTYLTLGNGQSSSVPTVSTVKTAQINGTQTAPTSRTTTLHQSSIVSSSKQSAQPSTKPGNSSTTPAALISVPGLPFQRHNQNQVQSTKLIQPSVQSTKLNGSNTVTPTLYATSTNISKTSQPTHTAAGNPDTSMKTSSKLKVTPSKTSTTVPSSKTFTTQPTKTKPPPTTTNETAVGSRPTPTTSPSSLSTTTILIIVAVFAIIALIFAIIFGFLYLRSSYGCYEMIRRSSSRNDNTSDVNLGEQHTISRERITSFSSIKIKLHICKSDPFSIKSFQNHVKRLHRDSDYLFSQEYEVIGSKKYLSENDKRLELVYTEGQKPENKPKNRYADILPYDHNRVILTDVDGDPNSSYINASYVDSYRKPNAYIAAQGPLPTTVIDFWRMVWESNTRVIVMITNLFERCKTKCAKYWPDEGFEDYGFFRIAIIKEETYANYVVRFFKVELVPDQEHYISINDELESRIIQQFHFTEWPDHDVPAHAPSILRFIHKSKAANPKDAGPIIVHCSAGVGRSGTYIVIDSMMQEIDDTKTVDIFNFLNHIRTQRNFLVQEESQYIFVHDAINDYTHFGDSNIPIENFLTHMNTLRRVSTESKTTSMRKEFEAIDGTKTPEKHKWVAKKACNTLKNRRKDVLPVERTRVKLPPVLGIEGGDYINASYIDGFSKKKEYIATQAPMRTTAESFWRMVKSTKCNMIVMLLNDEEWKKDDYFADLPTNEEAVSCGKQEIQLESEDILGDVTVRKLRVFSSDVSDGKSVKHYHYRSWPSDGIPKDKSSLISLIELIRDQKQTEAKNAPIIVNCDYGVGRTGMFCLLMTMYDQLEEEGSIDVYQTAKLYRTQRPQFIETEEQYSFCYEILEELVNRKLRAVSTKLPQNGNINAGISNNSINYEEPAVIDASRKLYQSRSSGTQAPNSLEVAKPDTHDRPRSETPNSNIAMCTSPDSSGNDTDSPCNDTPLIKQQSTSGTDNPRYRKSSISDTADTMC